MNTSEDACQTRDSVPAKTRAIAGHAQILRSAKNASLRMTKRSQRRQHSLPIWSCSVWGLPCPSHRCGGGALLPHLFTLTSPSLSMLSTIVILSRRYLHREGSWRAARSVAFFATHMPRVRLASLWHASALTAMAGRCIFCGTFRRVALTPPSRTLSGTLLFGVRTFLPHSLTERERPSGPAANRIIICDECRLTLGRKTECLTLM